MRAYRFALSGRLVLSLILGVALLALLAACRTAPSPGGSTGGSTPAPTPVPTAAAPHITPSIAPSACSDTLQMQRVRYAAGGAYLILELLDDDLVHFEYAAGTGPGVETPLYTTPMVDRTGYPGPARFCDDGLGHLETAALQLTVDAASLCVSVSDTLQQSAPVLTTLCPSDLGGEAQALTLAAGATQRVYGLGEHFREPGSPNGDWLGQVVRPGNAHGNAMTRFNGGSTGNAQFPVLYALGASGENYALFLDHVYAQTWDLQGDPWRVSTAGAQVRGYLLSGPDLPDLRADYMELTGRPPVPPKKMFGLWVSEYGYDNWDELEDKLHTLQDGGFPVDGFVMDLQWFGGVPTGMGSLTWDTARFPDPPGQIARLGDEEGVGLMLIEESYIASRPERDALQERGYLPLKAEGGDPVFLISWWGRGSMVDWTNPGAGDYWHDTKRQPLVDMGVVGHWTDLGEPEMYYNGWYHGLPDLGLHAHRDVHNLYNFFWIESIARGYARNGVPQRPFIMSRSGTSGIQRFGASMWSGDIGSNLSSLATHFNAQMHMSFSGLDYYGSDVGGFSRGALEQEEDGANEDEMYTQWFANSALLDVPVRPHTDNLCNCRETAPDRVGDPASNLANLRLRYSLVPYLYSLAHRAYLYGEPVAPPPVFYYQDDPNTHAIGDEKLLGRDLLVATVNAYGQTDRDVYLPAGTWVNYHTGEWVDSEGEWLRGVPLWVGGVFRLPLFARAGAIVPQMYVDGQTANVLGLRRDGSRHDELIVRVYAGAEASSFTLYEDDGTTVAYQQGALQTTQITQQRAGNLVSVTVEPASGSYDGAPEVRDNVLEIAVRDAGAVTASLNGETLPQYDTREALDAAGRGWTLSTDGLIVVRSGLMRLDQRKHFEIDLEGHPAG